MKSSIKTLAISATVSSVFFASNASAASLQTDVEIDIPSVIALYCYDKVYLKVSSEGFVEATGAFDGTDVTELAESGVSASNGNWNASIEGLNTSAGADFKPKANLNMKGVCAFRAVATTAGVNVSIELENGVLKHATENGANITATAAKLLNNGSEVSDYDVTDNLGFSRLNGIAIRLPLDLTETRVAGLYSSEDVFTVTVTAN